MMSQKDNEFIIKAREVHGDKYDYSKVKYVNSKTKVCIICPKHGEFWQIPSSHLRGIGCNKCGIEKRSKAQTLTTEEFIEKAREKHGGKYDYSRTVYNGCYGKVKIICPIHGEYEQAAYSHLNGHGCPKCMSEKNSKVMLMTTDEFIKKAKEVHRYENNDYSNVDYHGTKIPVEIVCEKGHHYMQMPNKHLSGHSCPYCSHNISNQEHEIVEFIRGLGIEVQTNQRNILGDNKEIDIFIPSHNIAIEFDGLYWHNSSMKENNYHINKTNECEKKGIRLIHIFEDEWMNKKDIVKSRIKNILGKTPNKIYGRNCMISEISYKEAKDFLETNHIQGYSVSSIRYGLYHKNELVAVMTFCGLRKNLGKKNLENAYELLRFCNRLDTVVIGGADKLLSHFIKDYKPNEIISYADRRWSQGNLYEKLNFSLYNVSPPNYFYVIGRQRFNRFNFRKDRLVKDGYDLIKTEKQIMEERGIPRIYDCGCLCYKWINNQNNG